MTYVVAQLGARMHYGVARVLEEASLLERLYTDIYASPALSRALKLVPQRLQPRAVRRLAGRRPWGIPADRVTMFPALGLGFWARQARSRSHEESVAAEISVAARFGHHVARRGFGRARGTYAYNTAALEVLQTARRHGVHGVLEQTMAPWGFMESLLEEERHAFPEWVEGAKPTDVARRYSERETAEWAAAERIVCASPFVRDGIAALHGPAEKCVVVPYGVDGSFHLPPRAPHPGPLRVLVLGRVGLRKGSPYVLEAARQLQGRAEIRMVGPMDPLPAVQARLAAAVDLVGQVPRSEILRHFAWADVFLLPSLCEGSATVIYEAMTASLPVVCTPNTGSIVRHGVDGLIVPPRDAQAIVDAVLHLAADAELRRAMALSAAARAAAHDLVAYGRRLLEVLALPTEEGRGR